MQKIPFMRPNVVKKEAYLKYLSEMDESRLYSNYGPLNDRFENRIVAEGFNGTGYVCTVNNATTGLILAISQAKRRNGKYALMPSFTFSATPLAAQWCGLEPYFVDINEDDWNMNTHLLDETIQMLGDQVGVIVPYAAFGSIFDLNYYENLQSKGIPVVIDAAASFGSTNGQNEQFGQGYSGYIVYSFHATKAFGIGEGGMIYTENIDCLKKVRQAGNFGYMGSRSSDTFGINGKMPEIMASIGLATLDVFQEKKKTRIDLYNMYVDAINNYDIISKGWKLQVINGEVPHQIMSILCPSNMKGVEIINYLDKFGVECKSYFSPACHRQKHFLACQRTTLDVTEDITSRIISLPFWEEMTVDQVNYVVNLLSEI